MSALRIVYRLAPFKFQLFDLLSPFLMLRVFVHFNRCYPVQISFRENLTLKKHSIIVMNAEKSQVDHAAGHRLETRALMDFNLKYA